MGITKNKNIISGRYPVDSQNEITVGDGVSSSGQYVGADHEVFEDAIESVKVNGIVEVNPGTYTFTDVLDVDKEGVSVVGKGLSTVIDTTEPGSYIGLSENRSSLKGVSMAMEGTVSTNDDYGTGTPLIVSGDWCEVSGSYVNRVGRLFNPYSYKGLSEYTVFSTKAFTEAGVGTTSFVLYKEVGGVNVFAEGGTLPLLGNLGVYSGIPKRGYGTVVPGNPFSSSDEGYFLRDETSVLPNLMSPSSQWSLEIVMGVSGVTSGGGKPTLFSLGYNTDPSTPFSLRDGISIYLEELGSDFYIVVDMSSTSNEYISVRSSLLPKGAYYHVVVACRGQSNPVLSEDVSIYVNGVDVSANRVDSVGYSGVVGSPSYAYIGAATTLAAATFDPSNLGSFLGHEFLMGHTAIYSKALDSKEVSFIYEAISTGIDSFYYDLSDSGALVTNNIEVVS